MLTGVRCVLFHESVKQMKQVKQDFELKCWFIIRCGKPVKQNVTKDKSVNL